MGQLTFQNFTILQSANGATGAGVTIQIYAWAENVELSGPTIGLALQSKDEYGTGPISRPASAVAQVARSLKTVPVIGRYATATEIGASAVSKIAKTFGWTNVPVISDAQPLRSVPFPQMASAEIGYPVEKLTLDPKNELTVDPSAAGLPSNDELALSNFLTRESYITSFPWTQSNVSDDILWTTAVTPAMWDMNNATNGLIAWTPMGLATQLFAHWKEDRKSVV